MCECMIVDVLLYNVYVYDLKLENEIFLWSIGNLKDIFFYMYFYLFI